MKLLLCILLFVSFNGAAKQIYAQNSECQLEDSEPIKVEQDYIEFLNRYNYTQVVDSLRSFLFDKAVWHSRKHPNGLKVKSFNIEYSERLHTVSYAYFILQPVKSCSKPVIVDQANLKLISLTNQKYLNKSEQDPNPLYIRTNLVTPESAFGAKLGESYAEIIERFGRFSLLWPINDTIFMAVLGRRHAFLFENQKFVGYHYNSELLPVSLTNMLEQTDVGEISVDGKNAYELGAGPRGQITKKHIELFKLYFDNIDWSTWKDGYDPTEKFIVVSGLSIGDWKISKHKANPIPCFDFEKDVEQFVGENTGRLISSVDKKGRLNYLTGCMQQIVIEHGLVSEVNLLEQWTTSRAKLLIKDNTLSQLSPWQFLTVKEGDPEEVLNGIGYTEYSRESVPFISAKWQGEFLKYDGMLYAAKLKPVTKQQEESEDSL
ncbi:hypothetical protein [Pseudoalteromonas luteoviolacea]|uniref:hypothetical protein n=1 Tax=Pseudoalteromonas luteoviolacea TaxID=43657 RepID=UPI001152FB10|nr:hypothetical protein [Pseudoalteromonas luteoviolacea]TQF66826.1 hypothetical protein FLM44_24940 [Pseudoalteromonas luteoviolacea]